MTVTFSQPDAVDRIKGANLKAGDWGGEETVCMMSALVSGASSLEDCVTAGWPIWLADINVILFDARVDQSKLVDQKARLYFALEIAKAVQKPRNINVALKKFLLARLDSGKDSVLKTIRRYDRRDWADRIKVIEEVSSLLKRDLEGDDISSLIAPLEDKALKTSDPSQIDWLSESAFLAVRCLHYTKFSDGTFEATDGLEHPFYDLRAVCVIGTGFGTKASRSDLIAALKSS